MTVPNFLTCTVLEGLTKRRNEKPYYIYEYLISKQMSARQSFYECVQYTVCGRASLYKLCAHNGRGNLRSNVQRAVTQACTF